MVPRRYQQGWEQLIQAYRAQLRRLRHFAEAPNLPSTFSIARNVYSHIRTDSGGAGTSGRAACRLPFAAVQGRQTRDDSRRACTSYFQLMLLSVIAIATYHRIIELSLSLLSLCVCVGSSRRPQPTAPSGDHNLSS